MTWDDAEKLYPGCSVEFDVARSLELGPWSQAPVTLRMGSDELIADSVTDENHRWRWRPMWIYLIVEEPGGQLLREWRFVLGSGLKTREPLSDDHGYPTFGTWEPY